MTLFLSTGILRLCLHHIHPERHNSNPHFRAANNPFRQYLQCKFHITRSSHYTLAWSDAGTLVFFLNCLHSTKTYYLSSLIQLPFAGKAIPGACPVNCFKQFVMFLSVMCFLKFIGATGRASNFLVSVRCVPEKDKTVAMGFGLMMMSLLAFIPSPIFFGWVLDKLCLVWGKTCTSKGNCWLYDAQALR